jgi:hypothetical protein
VPKDPVTSGNAAVGVFAYVPPYAAVSDRVSRPVDYSWRRSCGIVPVQQLFDLAVGGLLATVDALRVATQQDLNAVARALGHLGRVDAGVEPRRQRRVPKVVRTGRER